MDSITISIDLVAAAAKSEDDFFAHSSPDQLHEAAARYRKFLRLLQLYPNEILSPAKDVDAMWHLHMLHPVAYYHDCMATYGEILDHDGGFGLASELEWTELERVFAHTSSLWTREFNEDYTQGTTQGAAKCRKACARACRTACKKRVSVTPPLAASSA